MILTTRRIFRLLLPACHAGDVIVRHHGDEVDQEEPAQVPLATFLRSLIIFCSRGS